MSVQTGPSQVLPRAVVLGVWIPTCNIIIAQEPFQKALF